MRPNETLTILSKTTRKQITAECKLIRSLLEDNKHHYTDPEIIENLKIKRSTYYRRKAMIAEEDIKLWNELRKEPLERAILEIYDAIQKCYDVCKEIRDDPKAKPNDRFVAAQLCIKAKVHLFYYKHRGPNAKDRGLYESLQELEINAGR